jgi:hypothetical protein
VYLQSAIAIGRSWLEPLSGEKCLQSVFLQSAIAIGRSWLEPLSGEKCLQSVFAICNCNRTILAQTSPWGECLQSVFAICNCNRTILVRTPPFTSLGRMPAECICNLQLQSDDLGSNPSLHLPGEKCLQSVFAICNCNRASAIGQPSICNCSRTSAIAAEHLQLQPSICNCSRGCICNCSRAFAIAVQLQPSICNCSRASAIVTENAHAHVQFELRQRRASQLYPVKFRVKFITNIDAVGGWMPTASRSVGTFFLLIYSGIAAASRRGCPASGGPRHANHHVPNASGGGVCAPSVPCSGSALLATRAGQSHAATPRSAQRAKKDLDLSGALPNISRASAVAASLQRCN